MTINLTGPAGTVILTQTGNSLRGRWQPNSESVPVEGNVNGNAVTLCIIMPDERSCAPLTVNFNNMTMSGINSGSHRVRWTLKKRR